jgi:tetratricopeptide (TPR) repeat protein
MRYLYFILLLLSSNTFAQSQLEFNKIQMECEDRWIAFQPEDNWYTFGFIYVNEQAGPTMQYGGHFKILADGTFKLDTTQMPNMKIRLEPNRKAVALIPASKLTDLKVEFTPDWLAAYKHDSLTAENLYRRGFMYNSWDLSAKALPFLEKAKQIDPTLAVGTELAYTYNALGQYDKAIIAAKGDEAIATDKCYLYKEWAYSYTKLEQFTDAEGIYNTAVKACNDKNTIAEIAYNIAYTYSQLKDKTNFAKWATETRKWAQPNDQFSVNITKLESKL